MDESMRARISRLFGRNKISGAGAHSNSESLHYAQTVDNNSFVNHNGLLLNCERFEINASKNYRFRQFLFCFVRLYVNNWVNTK